MDYVGRIFRPPSEAPSLLLQVTVGCSHNRCTYCDALILSTRRLLAVLAEIREKLPWVERVGTYGDTRSVGKKSVAELRELREAGLGIVYHGMESGDDETLQRIDKGGTRDECIAAAAKLREAGVAHSVMVLLGIGGTDRSREHAEGTASVLTAMDPPYVGVLTTTVVPGTPLHAAQTRGEFVLPGEFQMLEELRTIVAGVELTDCRFSANHASNYLPVRSVLPRDKPALLEALDEVLARRDRRMLKPERLRGL